MHDPYAGRDARTRLLDEKEAFERFEPASRRVLIVVAVLAIGIGLAHKLMESVPIDPVSFVQIAGEQPGQGRKGQ